MPEARDGLCRLILGDRKVICLDALGRSTVLPVGDGIEVTEGARVVPGQDLPQRVGEDAAGRFVLVRC